MKYIWNKVKNFMDEYSEMIDVTITVLWILFILAIGFVFFAGGGLLFLKISKYLGILNCI